MRTALKILTIMLVLVALTVAESHAQQDPHYTQYMYNTMTINPGYTGSKDHLSFTALARTQWVGIEGAPDSQTFSFHTPIKYSGMGIGVNLIKDEIGPAKEIYFDLNLSYTLRLSKKDNVSLGLRLGGRTLNLDWSKGNFRDATDPLFTQALEHKFLPTTGAGLYYYSDKSYVGLSVPNFLKTEHYNGSTQSIAHERLHYLLIAGYVFQMRGYLKFKPAMLVKIVKGAPLSFDLSANFLFYERFTLGAAYRWDDSISAMVGIGVTKNLNIGYAYDLTTSNYGSYNFGSHELMLTYDVFRIAKLKSPRFF